MLRGRVSHTRNSTARSRRARHVDDGPIFFGLHKRQYAAHHLDRRGQVRGDDLFPDGITDAVGAAEVVHDASDVDEDVDAVSVQNISIISGQLSRPAQHGPKKLGREIWL